MGGGGGGGGVANSLSEKKIITRIDWPLEYLTSVTCSSHVQPVWTNYFRLIYEWNSRLTHYNPITTKYDNLHVIFFDKFIDLLNKGSVYLFLGSYEYDLQFNWDFPILYMSSYKEKIFIYNILSFIIMCNHVRQECVVYNIFVDNMCNIFSSIDLSDVPVFHI